VSAGDSVAREAARRRAQADERARLRAVARQLSRTFAAVPGGDRRLAATLLELEPLGWSVLGDRRLPGSSLAVCLVLVGPGGVVLIDSHDGRGVRIGPEGVVRGDEDLTADLARLADVVYILQGLLADIGLAPGEVSGVAVLTGEAVPASRLFGLSLLGEADAVAAIAGRPRRLDARQIALVRTEIERVLPFAGTPRRSEPEDDEPALAARLGAEQLDSDRIERVLVAAADAEPVERWMTFLHPDQARFVRRSFSGPARLRGAAGTGKTAVALHRAAHLARTTPGRVLVTSYVRTLPRVMAGLMERLAPDVADRVEFASVHALARRILTERHGPAQVDAPAADEAFREVWRRQGLESPLVAIDPAPQYWREELHHVIKGRGLTRFEEYEGLARTGRRRPLGRDQRAAMWRLYVAYEQELRRRGIRDGDDLVLDAEASLRAHPLERYDAVVVDEAQDLSCAMLRMLHLLVGDRPDGLLLVADGRQAIYPGGYTLAEAGISVAGRGAVLTTNYRATAELADVAALLLEGEPALDIEGAPDRSPATTLRHGPRPVTQAFESRALHDRSFVEHVRSIVAAGGRLGDIGVLALSSLTAREARAALEEAGIPTVELDRYDGRDDDAIKVGTIKRAKGLEFTDVLVVRAPLHLVRPLSGDVDPAVVEHRELQRRELYVAMTRARERVWVGVA
jgi:hypothetical protein